MHMSQVVPFPEEAVKQLFLGQLDFAQQCELIEQLSADLLCVETLTQLTHCARQFEQHVAPVPVGTLDIVGTGGDGMHTLNFSTLSAMTVAALGHPVAKHGNRSVTSRCGSIDLLQQFGVPLPKTASAARALLQTSGLAFLFAGYFHPAFAHVMQARQWFAEQGRKTIFNVLGPLINPAHVRHMLVGVYDPRLLRPYACALQQLGVQAAYIVHGYGLDEATLTGPTQYIRVRGDELVEGIWRPMDFALSACALADIQGGSPAENFSQSQALLSGKLTGPKRDMVILNAGLALHIAYEFSVDLHDCLQQVAEVLASGKVWDFVSCLSGKY